MPTINRLVRSEFVDEFRFELHQPVPDFCVEAFSSWLSAHLEQGAKIIDGQMIQYGYSFLLCRTESRVLHLLAPDYQSFPIQWTDDLSKTFSIALAHKYVPETFGLEPKIPGIRDTAIVGSRFTELPFFLDRLTPVASNPHDSGWFVAHDSDDVDNNDPEQLRCISLYELAIALPSVLDFLSLPVGCQVLFSNKAPKVLRDYQELDIPNGSYLHQLLFTQG